MMSKRLSRLLSPVALLFAAGCSSSSNPKTITGPDGIEGRPLKVSYFRFQREEAKGRLQPTFYMMLSCGWRNRFGPQAREPFERITTNIFRNIEVADVNMEEIVRAIKEKGWDSLPATDVSKIDMKRIVQIGKDAAASPDAAAQTRYLTVHDGETCKTVSNEDAHRMGQQFHRVFLECEILTMKVAMPMTVKVTAETMPLR